MQLRVLVSFFLLVLVFTPMTGLAVTIEELESRLDQLREQDKALQERADAFRELVGQAQKEITGIKREINGLTYEINILEAEIERTQNEIELTTLQIEKLGLEVIKTLDQIEEAKLKTSETLKKLYQAEQVSAIELVFSGSDFSDFWDQHQYFSSFQTSLNNTIYQMEQLKEDLEAKIREQESRRASLKDLEEQRAIQQAIVADKRTHQKGLLAQNEEEKRQYQETLSETEGERRRIIEEILKTEEEVKRLRNFELYLKSGQIPPTGTKIFVWPTKQRTVTQGYGATAFARSGVAGYRFHNGIDLAGAEGTPVYAAADGEVIARNTGTTCPNHGRLRNFGCEGGWGNWVAIQHPNGIVTLYAHMAKPSYIGVGNAVKAGDTIGFIGSSGNVTGPHLHFSAYTEFFLVPKGYPGYNPEGTLNPLLYL